MTSLSFLHGSQGLNFGTDICGALLPTKSPPQLDYMNSEPFTNRPSMLVLLH